MNISICWRLSDNSNWNPASFTVEDAKVAEDQNPFDIATWNGNISAFQNNGGKLRSYGPLTFYYRSWRHQVHYHGQMDPIITSENSPVYYNLVSRTMGLNSSSLADFYRFFRISGMGHCEGGDGASFIGNLLASVSTMDPQNNVLLRIVDWVENGNAPETVTGTKFVNVSSFRGWEMKVISSERWLTWNVGWSDAGSCLREESLQVSEEECLHESGELYLAWCLDLCFMKKL